MYKLSTLINDWNIASFLEILNNNNKLSKYEIQLINLLGYFTKEDPVESGEEGGRR